MDKEFLLKLAKYKMPFGKFKDHYLIDLPEEYFIWFSKKGYPQGNLGEMMKAAYEIKINGLEELVRNVRDTQIER
jgi:uncharacterized protein (DUF3820 family)